MIAGIFFTGTGPILLLTSYTSLDAPELVTKLYNKGIRKYIACEVPVELVRERYGTHFSVVLGDLSQDDDLRVLDYNGHNVFYRFEFREMGAPVYHTPTEWETYD